MDSLQDVSTGRYLISTASGTIVLVDLDDKTAIRAPAVTAPQEGFHSNPFDSDGTVITGVEWVNSPKVGAGMSFRCDPPLNWYISTKVVRIEESE